MNSQPSPRYKWIALSNTTLGMLLATINSSIILISLPAIFDGIGVDPLASENTSYLLWLMMGYQLVTAVGVMSLGRLGDILGRVRIYNLGFAVFALSSIALALVPFSGGQGAMWLIVWRMVQGIGGAMLFANSSAIIADAFPPNRRGFATGINQIAAIAGSFLGLIIGGMLAVVDWRAIFWVSVPFSVIGTIWGFLSLKNFNAKGKVSIDWAGNIIFAFGLTSLLVGIIYGIQPYGDSAMGWGSPWVLSAIFGGLVLLAIFFVVETKVSEPMIDLHLFKIRAFWTGSVANFTSATARGGMQFMLIIWLQGIWLPLHGYSFESTPFWSAIYLLPLTAAFLISGPVAGFMSDRIGARALGTIGMLIYAASFIALLLIPVNFDYWMFGLLIFINGIGTGMFSAPNSTAIMNSVAPNRRGAAAGIQGLLTNSGSVLSMGLFFSLMIIGLSHGLPSHIFDGLTQNGVPTAEAQAISALPPVAILFSTFLGYNPMEQILGSAQTAHVSTDQWGVLTSNQFFPQLISDPFAQGLTLVFLIAAAMALIAAVASALRGKNIHHVTDLPPAHHVSEHLQDLAAASAGLPGEIALEDERR